MKYLPMMKIYLFFLMEKDINDIPDNEIDLNNLMDEFKNIDTPINMNENKNLQKFVFKNEFYCKGLFNHYNEKYTVNQLLKICEYYGLLKCVKMAKYKKNEIIDAIINFETNLENNEIIIKRQQLWSYLEELLKDPFMKKFIIWT